MKRIVCILLSVLVLLAALAACSNTNSSTGSPSSGAQSGAGSSTGAANNFKTDKKINVVSREDGSGTRGAFIELFGIEVKGDDGTKKDTTTKEAVIAKQTDVMMTNIAGDPYAIGYISLGSLNETVKALTIEGVVASTENVKNGTYEVARPFIIATKGEPTGLAKDFIDFILSSEGQAVVNKSYISVTDNAAAYAGSKPAGRIVVTGSSSVSPLMEKLIEAYQIINPDAKIEMQSSDSSSGMKDAIEGTCDIGMSSRELKESEAAELSSTQIALDGIAVIVNTNSPLVNLTKEQVRQIFTGETTKWSEVIQ